MKNGDVNPLLFYLCMYILDAIICIFFLFNFPFIATIIFDTYQFLGLYITRFVLFCTDTQLPVPKQIE